MIAPLFYNRDLSWLGFNERVLLEADKNTVPILERIKFLSIYSSNLDEFYRVRMPVLMALAENYEQAKLVINQQQEKFGKIITEQILPLLAQLDIYWIYNKAIPDEISVEISGLFFNEVLTYIHSERIDDGLTDFFAENNKLYQVVMLNDKFGNERMELISIPSDTLSRLYSLTHGHKKYVVFLEDIIKNNIRYLFPDDEIQGVYNLKITRDAELKIDVPASGDISETLEVQLESRDLGFATRFLCEPGIPLRNLYQMIYALNLGQASIVEGGTYHNLKDLANFPLQGDQYSYVKWPAVDSIKIVKEKTLFDEIQQRDILLNVPYQKYDPVLRFFNEAANDPYVQEIYTTLYRVANNSRIVSALITAAKNGKQVTVLVELKARFDEANNLKWAKKMKIAGVKIIYSSLDLKVHAKVALLKRRSARTEAYLGLLATGNFNETTAKFYTDHVLFTAHQPMLAELEQLFGFLSQEKKEPASKSRITFKHLLVAQFNLQQRFLDLIQREIDYANDGKFAEIIIKLNNLEEKVLITKLYEASQAGVQIKLIIRGICCLLPGIKGLSENITVTRIVDRFLEHGRVFIFENNGNREIFMGSADWMNRNIYSRIEVCYPLYDAKLKSIVMNMINLHLNDNAQQSIYLFLQNQTDK